MYTVEWDWKALSRVQPSLARVHSPEVKVQLTPALAAMLTESRLQARSGTNSTLWRVTRLVSLMVPLPMACVALPLPSVTCRGSGNGVKQVNSLWCGDMCAEAPESITHSNLLLESLPVPAIIAIGGWLPLKP